MLRSRFVTGLFPRVVPKAIARRYSSAEVVGNPSPRILITGALGQIGAELIQLLRTKYGRDNVVASDVKLPKGPTHGPFVYVDVLDYHTLAKVVVDYRIDWIVHNSSVISGVGEMNPQRAMDVNVTGVRNVFDICKNFQLRVLAPSTIAVFSPESGKVMTKDDTVLNPTTVYGVTKVFLEQAGEYYNQRFGMDFRCLRYPGIISGDTLPGGGTTDYAVLIFYDAVKHGRFVCNLDKDEALPMMYMPDCLKATIDLLEVPRTKLSRGVYNVAAMSFTPAQVAAAIKKHIPGFEIEYAPDFRQDIAHTWPDSLDDTLARKDWDWAPMYDLDAMVVDMLAKIEKKVAAGEY
ncbi:threonine 3-dehydrogenase [Diplonema papillatum]|nr:threonine 3-dehydrogenase [Diplonema papillatum]